MIVSHEMMWKRKNFQRNAGNNYAKYHQLKHLINTPSQSNLKTFYNQITLSFSGKRIQANLKYKCNDLPIYKLTTSKEPKL